MQSQESKKGVLELHDAATKKLKDFIESKDNKELSETETMKIKAAMTSLNGAVREMAVWRDKEAAQLKKILIKIGFILIGFWVLFWFPCQNIIVPEEAPVRFGLWYIAVLFLVWIGLAKVYRELS